MSFTFGDQLNFLSSLLADSNTDSESQWPLAQRKTELNFAEKQFARDSKLLMENTTGTASSKVITLPTDWLETYCLYVTVSGVKYRVTNDREISPKALEEGNLYAGDIPYYYFWTFSGTRKITLVGSSNLASAAYDLYYFAQPTTALSDTTDTSEIPEEYRQAPVYKAASNLLLQIGQYTRSQALMQMYDRLVAQASSEAQRQYIDTNYPRPDVLGMGMDDVTDRQGHGF